LKCWGDNTYGQLGPGVDLAVGDSPDDLGANLATVLSDVTSMSAGDWHTCAVQQRAVKCWGSNHDGEVWPPAADSSFIQEPTAVDTSGPAQSVCAGGRSTFALLEDGTVEGWGYVSLLASVEGVVAAQLSGPAKSLSCGGFAACALLISGEVECWGYPDESSGWPQPMAVTVAGREPPVGGREVEIVQVERGLSHACALYSNGQLRCWGYQLGYGTIPDGLRGDSPLTENWPVEATGRDLKNISASRHVTCGVSSDGGAVCWGENIYGVLARPPADDEYLLPVELPDIETREKVKSVSTGGYHACAILSSGRIKCWGDNSRGQLGIGSTVDAIGDHVGEMGSLESVFVDD
jgi:alpha-tubulin suppressor-like RCC1 family protein